MSRSYAMHADEMVVGGGASIISDRDHRPIRRKATTSSTNLYPGSWAYLGMTFLLLTSLSCQLAFGIEGDIFPENGIIEVGTNLNITCTLRNESGAAVEMPSARDIVWYKGTHFIPSDEYHMVNETVSSISIVNAVLNDSATYRCALNHTNIGDYLSSVLQVGYKPQPAFFLTCASHNIIDFYCEWDPVLTHIVNESHTFQYVYKGQWTNCSDNSSTPRKCVVKYGYHTGMTQRVRVVSSNDLGDGAIREASFNPSSEAIPYPPSNLTVISESSTELVASWDLPPDWPEYYQVFLKYRLRWASKRINPREWKELLCPGSGLSCTFGELEPYTEYEVEVACWYTFNVNRIWGNWSNPVEGRTDQTAPTGTVQNVQTIDLNGTSDYNRNVLISWETVPEPEQRGPILGYIVTVESYSSCLEQNFNNNTVNETEVIVEGLEKFCSYMVKITAFNSVGSGPAEEGTVIEDKTTNPLPPSVVEAETQSHQSVLVTWNIPTHIQGYIRHYTVHWIKARGQDLGQSRQVNASSLSYIVGGLEGYVLYSFKVSVTNRIGVGGWSRAVQTTTKEWIPEASPSDLTVEPNTDSPNSLLVNWIDVSEEDAHGQIQNYTLYYCRVAEDSLSILCSLNFSDCLENHERRRFPKASPRPVTLTSLAPFSHYLTWISASTSVGEGPRSKCPSPGRTIEGAPSQPLNVSVTSSNSTSIGLTWSPPLEKNGIIRNYRILVTSNASTEQQEFYSEGVGSYLVEGLQGYIHYTIQVQACTSILCGNASAEVYQQTDIGVPEQPENLNVRPKSHNLVTLSWDQPVHPNGPIDHYLVSYRHAEEQSTPSPAIVNVRSASRTTSLANSIDKWFMTTELTMEMEVDCSQAPFLFQVVAVNVLKVSPSVGEAARSVLPECILIETTLSPLIWLILPGGAILLFGLLTSLYYVQSKLGKSWPDPVYPDMVKNKQDIQPRPNRFEKEEFDAIQIGRPSDIRDVVVAEEFPSQPNLCPIQTSRSNSLTNSIDIKGEIGSKHEHLRTVSIDSGIPFSPQDQLDFSSSDDVFDIQDQRTSTDNWMQDTYSFNEQRTMVSHTGLAENGGYLPKISVSLSNSIGHWDHLPVIQENKSIALTTERVPGEKDGASSDRDWLGEDEEDGDAHETAYTVISKLSYLKKQPAFGITDQNQSVVAGSAVGPTQGGGNDKLMTPNPCTAGPYVRGMQSTVYKVAQNRLFTCKPDNGYVCNAQTPVGVGHQLARPLEESLTSSYVSKESMTCSKIGVQMAHVIPKNGIIPSSQPCVQTESIGYVKLQDISRSDKMQTNEDTKKQKSSKNDVTHSSHSACSSDYVKGVDLHNTLESKRVVLNSLDSPGSAICTAGETGKSQLQDGQENSLDRVTEDQSVQKGVRSPSGYEDEYQVQASGYVAVPDQLKETSENDSNLVFTSSGSERDSNDDVKSEKEGVVKDERESDRCLISVSSISDDAGTETKSKEFESSYVKYFSNDGRAGGLVKDHPRSDPPEGQDTLGFSYSITPFLKTKEQLSCQIDPGYVSHSAILGADKNGNITPEDERLTSPATPKDISNPDIYQVPSRVSRELQSKRTGHETAEGDDGYIPLGEDDGYVLRVLDQNQVHNQGKYMPMSPIEKS